MNFMTNSIVQFIGRTLANKSRPERKPNITCPPARSPFGLIAPGQPIAPKELHLIHLCNVQKIQQATLHLFQDNIALRKDFQ